MKSKLNDKNKKHFTGTEQGSYIKRKYRKSRRVLKKKEANLIMRDRGKRLRKSLAESSLCTPEIEALFCYKVKMRMI